MRCVCLCENNIQFRGGDALGALSFTKLGFHYLFLSIPSSSSSSPLVLVIDRKKYIHTVHSIRFDPHFVVLCLRFICGVKEGRKESFLNGEICRSKKTSPIFLFYYYSVRFTAL